MLVHIHAIQVAGKVAATVERRDRRDVGSSSTPTALVNQHLS
jgi:hypothetical protein